ncbi:MAG: hypothetical protein QW303_01350 [Nitrososphaerota archaeon]
MPLDYILGTLLSLIWQCSQTIDDNGTVFIDTTKIGFYHVSYPVILTIQTPVPKIEATQDGTNNLTDLDLLKNFVSKYILANTGGKIYTDDFYTLLCKFTYPRIIPSRDIKKMMFTIFGEDKWTKGHRRCYYSNLRLINPYADQC